METAKDILMGLESQLVKVILSKAQSGKYNKSVILPFDSNNNVVWQIQEFTDKQVFHKNTTFLNILQYVEQFFGSVFRQINIIAADCEYSGIVSKKGKVTFVKIKTTHKERNTLHNRVKNYILNEGDDIPILRDLGIFTAENKIVKAMYDKFKQVNRFVEMIDDALKSFHKSEITILDFGCGKSYLTFVVYYYLTMIKGLKANIIGYDIKQDVVENCNKLAQKYDYNGIKFFNNDVTVDSLYQGKVDVLITLHACDIATDYALAYAIRNKAPLVFSVPCCQHEVNKQIKYGGEYDLLLRDGLLKERFCALLTDSIRAEILRDFGYKVDVLEFVDFSHSPKNIMLRCKLSTPREPAQNEKLKNLMQKYQFHQSLYDLMYK